MELTCVTNRAAPVNYPHMARSAALQSSSFRGRALEQSGGARLDSVKLQTMRAPCQRGLTLCRAHDPDQEKFALTRQKFERFISGELSSEEGEELAQHLCDEMKQLAQSAKNAVPGIAIGAPLVTMAAFFTTLHYGELNFNAQDAYLQILIGYFTYGYDRLLDALESGLDEDVAERKRQLYDTILHNKPQVIATLAASFGLAVLELSKSSQTLPFIPLLLSTLAYKDIKTNNGTLKPFYIAAMWTACSVALPCIMHDKDYSILSSPQDLLPMALLMFGATNILDSFDIQEDSEKGINTLPVQIGKNAAFALSTGAISTALFLISQRVSELYFSS